MPDLSTRAGREWWAERRRYLVRDLDIDGFKTDGGEHAWGSGLRYNDGTRGDDGNNLNPVRYAQTYGDLLRSCGKAPVTFSRSGFTGSQAHGAFWAGDEDSTWPAFRASVRAGITAGACGVVYWGWDIAGFSGPPPSPELYLRAAAASVFMPIMQYHSEFNHHQLPLRDRTPWNIAAQSAARDADRAGNQTEGASTKGDLAQGNLTEENSTREASVQTPEPRRPRHLDVIADFRRLVQLRERLTGYLAAQARRAVTTDKPLTRGLFFDWPDDTETWNHPLQYLLGDDLLINPVTAEGVTTWDTYLPDGEWVDVWTGTRHQGRQTVASPVPERTDIPVFCRADSWPGLKEAFSTDA
jgi:alpha-glucosidase (family GH31 glycosyl hydrolase)